MLSGSVSVLASGGGGKSKLKGGLSSCIAAMVWQEQCAHVISVFLSTEGCCGCGSSHLFQGRKEEAQQWRWSLQAYLCLFSQIWVTKSSRVLKEAGKVIMWGRLAGKGDGVRYRVVQPTASLPRHKTYHFPMLEKSDDIAMSALITSENTNSSLFIHTFICLW
jgi:hypothetical protein